MTSWKSPRRSALIVVSGAGEELGVTPNLLNSVSTGKHFLGEIGYRNDRILRITPIPEPTTCTLALAALCLAMTRRRSH